MARYMTSHEHFRTDENNYTYSVYLVQKYYYCYNIIECLLKFIISEL